MQRWRALGLMVLARLKIFYREPEALFWVYFFPIIMAIALAVAFRNRPPEPPQVDVIRTSTTSEAEELAEQLNAGGVQATVQDDETALKRYRVGKTALFVSIQGKDITFGFDPTRTESVAAKNHVDAVVRRWKSPDAVATVERLDTEPGNRYIDFLVPGLMGMNILGGGMWGLGFVIVDLRVRKLLKRMVATPMRRGDFLASMLIARLIMLGPEMLSLYLVGRLAFGVPMRGNLVALAILMVVGALAACGMGLLCASRTEKSETVVGFINLIVLPMWLFSGVFFSSKKFPDAIQPFIQALPLTQINDGLREVMLEGKTLGEVAWRIAILAVYAVVGFAIALRIFRWK